jgi:DNA-binding response OmpR family regulator
MSSRILIVEDDPSLAHVLRDNLLYEGYVVEQAVDGSDALEKTRSFAPDLVLLDLTLPHVDGLEICRILGASEPRVAMVILTARGRHEEKVRGLKLGADDYVTKPFSLEELLARISAVLRRTRRPLDQIRLGDVTVDLTLARATRGSDDLALTRRECDLLRYLAERPGKVASRDELLRVVWGYHEATLTRTIDNFIARLRRKIETDPRHPRYIRTVHGDGYSLVI